MNASVLAVCIVHQVKRDPNQVGRTAIDKRAVGRPVPVGPLGLEGDEQCDHDRHGGPDQAVYAYDVAESRRWAAELGRDLPPGVFGENLVLQGCRVTDAVIGEHWQIGPEVRVEVTLPRIPCATFGRHLGEPHWVRRFTERGDVGAYLRVLRGGEVAAGQEVRTLSVPQHGITVREVFRALMNGPADPQRLTVLLAQHTLAAKLRRKLEDLLAPG